MDTTNACPDCGHPKSQHTFVGCLYDGNDVCDCERDFPEARRTPETAEAEKVEAMGRAVVGTDPAWEGHATAAALWCAANLETFCADDVWERLEHQNVPPPREPRALGPILTRLRKDGKAKGEGYVPSKRRHGSPVMSYRAVS